MKQKVTYIIRKGELGGEYLQNFNDPCNPDDSGIVTTWTSERKKALRYNNRPGTIRLMARLLRDTPCRVVTLRTAPLRIGVRVILKSGEVEAIVSHRVWDSTQKQWNYSLLAVDGSGLIDFTSRDHFQLDRGDGTVKREDGKRVRKNRWEAGIRNIVNALHGSSYEFEIDDIVREVEQLSCMKIARDAINQKSTRLCRDPMCPGCDREGH